MSAIFEMPIDRETLAPEELAQITGCARKGDQIEWLSCDGLHLNSCRTTAASCHDGWHQDLMRVAFEILALRLMPGKHVGDSRPL